MPAGRSTTAAAARVGLAQERLCGLPAPDREWLNRGLPCPKSACPPGVPAPVEKGAPMPVMIGVDPHKASHTAAALDEHGQLLDRQRIAATLDGYRQLRQ